MKIFLNAVAYGVFTMGMALLALAITGYRPVVAGGYAGLWIGFVVCLVLSHLIKTQARRRPT
jgi:putative Mn2+ efflux pump MntP